MKLHVKDLNVAGKRVLVRVDFNVPHNDDGTIRDDTRVIAALPTINELINKGAKVILMSHLGKIKFKKGPEAVAKAKVVNNMAPIAKCLADRLDKPVIFVDATRGEILTAAVAALKDGEVLLMQNTRYEEGETKNDAEIAGIWANLADAFVMDAFGSAHRAHASTYGVAEILNKEGKPTAIGYLMEKEIINLQRCVDVKAEGKPYIAILGGLKVSDKIQVIESLLTKCDRIIICGAMAYTFFKAKGFEIGTSPVENDQLDYANKCLASGKIVLPVDNVIADEYKNAKVVTTVNGDQIPAHMMGMDIGPKTRVLFADEIAKANTIFWNGPAGVFEQKQFQTGTIALCQAIADNHHCFSVVGGGDSAAAVKQLGFASKFSHISTGGGASLQIIENNGHLPGIDIISEAKYIKARKKIIFGNWKMNNTIADAKNFCVEADVITKLAKEKDIVVGIAPSYLALQYVVDNKAGLKVFAEETHFADHGAFTGNVSIPMLQEIKVEGSLVGHSERRAYHGETDLVCNRKIKALVKANMGVMYCCGETLKEYEAGLAKDVIRAQVSVALMDLTAEDLKNVYIAYEPVWSIGTGRNASEQIANDMCAYIRSIVRELVSEEAAEKISILYGGSVKPFNVKGYLASDEVDGALVGGASLTASSFEELIKNV